MKEEGIYRVKGLVPFEFQIVVGSELDEGEHLYFKSLTNHISRRTFSEYVSCFGKLKGDRRKYADIILELIISANQEEVKRWKEDEKMCQAVRMLMNEELCNISEDQEEVKRWKKDKKMFEAMRVIMDEELNEERKQGIEQGIEQGESLFANLMQKLFSDGRIADAEKAAQDASYRDKLMKEYSVASEALEKKQG